MENYFDKERELAQASKEFNRKTAIYNLKYESVVEEFLDATMFEAYDLKETAAWYTLRHTEVVEKLLEYDYRFAINKRILKFKEPFTITETMVFGQDEDRLARMKALSETANKVESIREAVESGTIKEALTGIKELIPLYCLFENDAAEMVKEKLEKVKEDGEKEAEEAKAKEEDNKEESESEELEPAESPDDQEDQEEDKNDDEDLEKKDDDSDDEVEKEEDEEQ